MAQGIWLIDPATQEERFVYYSELEEETMEQFLKPVGGFVFKADLFKRMKLAPVPFYVRDWLPKMGKAMIYAPAKTGKSYLCLQLARCIGIGEAFLGLPTTKGRVLYLQFELGEKVLQDRMAPNEYENVFVGTSFSMKLDTKTGQEQAKRIMDAVEPDVLILDPKIRFITGDENESKDMQPIITYLDSLIEGYHCSVLVIDHSGKDLDKRNKGSTIWEGWVDSDIQMKRVSKKGENLRVQLQPVFLRHAALPPDPIEAELNTVDNEFHVVGLPKTVEEQIIQYCIQNKKPVAPGELLSAGIGSNTSVYKALNKLTEGGKLDKVGRGNYQWKQN